MFANIDLDPCCSCFPHRTPEPPSVSPALVWFEDERYHEANPGELTLQWDPFNLTMNRDAQVSISLWGYKEDTIEPRLLYIEQLESNLNNIGYTTINPEDFGDMDHGPELRDCEVGMIMINLTSPETEFGMSASP